MCTRAFPTRRGYLAGRHYVIRPASSQERTIESGDVLGEALLVSVRGEHCPSKAPCGAGVGENGEGVVQRRTECGLSPDRGAVRKMTESSRITSDSSAFTHVDAEGGVGPAGSSRTCSAPYRLPLDGGEVRFEMTVA